MIDPFKTIRSFKYAFEGVVALFRFENNARVHLLLATVAIAMGIWIQLAALEWALVALAIGGVWAAEAFNTALEKLCDLVSPQFHPQIKAIKDLAAAGVLLLALAAVGVGLAIFVPKLF
ncbi:MAG: diacylglycerol kinase family protein [Runella slithyformis]|nr:MAG: diacylglycerol kinase family protein [Runella slithyformis]